MADMKSVFAKGISLYDAGKYHEAFSCYETIILNMSDDLDFSEFGTVFLKLAMCIHSTNNFELKKRGYEVLHACFDRLQPGSVYLNELHTVYKTVSWWYITMLEKRLAMTAKPPAPNETTIRINTQVSRRTAPPPVSKPRTLAVPQQKIGASTAAPDTAYTKAANDRSLRPDYMARMLSCSMENSKEILINNARELPVFTQETGGYFLVEKQGNGSERKVYPGFGIDYSDSARRSLISLCYNFLEDFSSGATLQVKHPAIVKEARPGRYVLIAKGSLTSRGIYG